MTVPFRGWIVEGVSGSGKTTLIKHYQAVLAERRPASTKLLISEHYTERVLEDEKSQQRLTTQTVLSHFDDLVSDLDTFARRKSQSKFSNNATNAMIDVVLERFLGSHYANLSVCGLWDDSAELLAHIETLYRRTCDWGLGVLVLTLPEKLIPRVISGTRHHRNSAWCTYLDSLGREEQVTKHFIDWQGKLISFYAMLSMKFPVHIVAIPNNRNEEFYRALAEALSEPDLAALASLGGTTLV